MSGNGGGNLVGPPVPGVRVVAVPEPRRVDGAAGVGRNGGVGIAARGFEDLPDLLGRVRLLVEGCTCEAGCPSCVQSPKCGNGNRPLVRSGAARVLRLLLGEEAAAVTRAP